MIEVSSPSALSPLMSIADRYARQLMAQASLTTGVLLIERDGQLDIIRLDDEHGNMITTAQRLLTEHGATSAALLLEVSPSVDDLGGGILCIFGGSVAGETAERRYRIRGCGRTRRLTPVSPRETLEVPVFAETLFSASMHSAVVDAVPGDCPLVAPLLIVA
jgi:hypothetical protein